MATYERITTNDDDNCYEQVKELADQVYRLARYNIAYWPSIAGPSLLWHSALMVVEDEE